MSEPDQKPLLDVRGAHLAMALEVAVPLWISQLQRVPWASVMERAKVCSGAVAARGDLLLTLGPRKGDTAEVFNRLAEGIACLAFAPGGVRLAHLRLHFEARHPEASPASPSSAP